MVKVGNYEVQRTRRNKYCLTNEREDPTIQLKDGLLNCTIQYNILCSLMFNV